MTTETPTLVQRAADDLRALPLEEQTLSVLLDRQAGAMGAKCLLRAEGEDRSYSEMRDVAAEIAGTLREAGIGAGDRVAYFSNDAMRLIEVWFGCFWTGAVLVPVNTEVRGIQLGHVLRDSGAGILITDHEHLEHVQALPEQSPELRTVWLLDGDDDAELGDVAVGGFPGCGEPVGRTAAHPGDAVAIIYTSGTTGPAKGVVCPNAQWLWFSANATDSMGLVESDVIYTCLPLFHVNGLGTVIEAMSIGATCVSGPRFSASRFWARLVEAEATVTFLLGVMMPILLNRPEDPAEREHSVRVALAGATPGHLAEPFRERFNIALVDGYASTETNMVMRNPPDSFRPGMIGYLAPGFEAKIVDEYDRELPDETPGELLLRADAPFAFSNGYFGLPERTVESRRNFWFHTGDRVVRHEDGYFSFVDRMNDAIRRRGENISAFEIEQVLESHPGIESAAAFPVPSQLGEDDVMVTVLPAVDPAPEPAELISWCKTRLGKFAIPRYVDVVDELPTTPSGKVTKTELRERGVTSTTFDSEA